ncbi:somatomedin-B and thrombospondin type-1 domain-containing protein-like [Lineus longissimus]|uniref:somatomedin-B and thrombospondin type-1 domain-containing protein-like n=1 Tax=Lineus longissimus TaxID=88925 RepID=UPI00315C6AA2
MERIVSFSGLLIVVIISLCFTKSADASCERLVGGCCKGLNSSSLCNVANGITMKGQRGKCYCDESCLKTQDCCSDYKTFCQATDCEVGDWSKWGRCSRECGEGGESKRQRLIIVKSSNGGKKCPELEETMPCVGRSCHQRRDTFGRAVRETARIIPARFGRWRTSKMYDATRGIRKNLWFHYSKNEIITKPSYFANYELVSTRRACEKNIYGPWAGNLKKGQTICVECQVTAMHQRLGVRCKGHGAYEQMTRWNAMNVPGCHGMWVQKSQHRAGTCPVSSETSFIFV